MDNIIKELEKMKKKIEEVKRNEATEDGKLQESFKRLKEQFGFTTDAEAIEALTRMKSKEKILKTKAEKQLKELQENYEW